VEELTQVNAGAEDHYEECGRIKVRKKIRVRELESPNRYFSGFKRCSFTDLILRGVAAAPVGRHAVYGKISMCSDLLYTKINYEI
jgi:hypothetical protein